MVHQKCTSLITQGAILQLYRGSAFLKHTFSVNVEYLIFKFHAILTFRQIKLHSIMNASECVLMKAAMESSKPAKNLQDVKVSNSKGDK